MIGEEDNIVPAATSLRLQILTLYAGLLCTNVGVGAWALWVFSGDSVKLGTALLAYTLGLRHAVDADHIAAIDNVTRKLIQDGNRPIAVGLYFALGHSAIVLIATCAIALMVGAISRFGRFSHIGAVIATVTSASFLFAIAAMNIVILRSLSLRFSALRRGKPYDDDLNVLLCGRGPLSRLLRPLFSMVTRSWQMALLGFLFGLGFDTATEVSLMGVAGTQAAHGTSLVAVLVFPALFAVGMALVDTTDGILMLGAYEWASVRPARKLYYNMTITGVSALVAIVIGSVETAALIATQCDLRSGAWGFATSLLAHFNAVGFGIIGLFTTAWAASYFIYRWKGFDDIEAPISNHE
jgi:high-affinity nickel-transport protein